MASTAQSPPSRPSRSWLRLVAFFFTAVLGWFFGAYVGSMFSGPPDSAVVTEQPAVAIPADLPATGVAVNGGSPVPPTASAPAAIATVAPTAVPTAVPSPTPPGRGATLQGEGLAIQLVDFELRPEGHPENAAIRYTLRFTNSTSRPLDIRLNLADAQAMDNNGVQYRDYFALANEFAEARCGIGPSAPRYLMNLSIQVPAQGSKQFDFYLNKTSVEGSCASRGAGHSRVDPTTQFVDVQLGTITYTGDGPRELQSGWWRLARGG